MSADIPELADGPPVERFNRLWNDCAGPVLAYAKRHVGAGLAEDVLSDTFMVAWRRIDEMPEYALPWLLVVARNTVANQKRAGRRHDRLQVRIARLQSVATMPGVDIAASDRDEVLTIVASLTEGQREAVLLTAWDGLTPSAAAKVAGCSAATFQVRLHRARRNIQAAMSTQPMALTQAEAVRSSS